MAQTRDLIPTWGSSPWYYSSVSRRILSQKHPRKLFRYSAKYSPHPDYPTRIAKSPSHTTHRYNAQSRQFSLQSIEPTSGGCTVEYPGFDCCRGLIALGIKQDTHSIFWGMQVKPPRCWIVCALVPRAATAIGHTGFGLVWLGFQPFDSQCVWLSGLKYQDF